MEIDKSMFDECKASDFYKNGAIAFPSPYTPLHVSSQMTFPISPNLKYPMIDFDALADTQPCFDRKWWKKFYFSQSQRNWSEEQDAFFDEVIDYCTKQREEYREALPDEMAQEITDFWFGLEDELLGMLPK